MIFFSNKLSFIYSFSLILLLGFELSYYLLIVQTGVTGHFNSDLVTLSPLFFGGLLGTFFSFFAFNIKPIFKIFFFLCLQLILSFIYPNFNALSLFFLGISVGVIAPLSVFIFNSINRFELMFSLVIAYSIGTYFFNYPIEERSSLAIYFSSIALLSSFLLFSYNPNKKFIQSSSFSIIFVLSLWVFLDSFLFESLSRSSSMNIWFDNTYLILISHLLGLLIAFFSKFKVYIHHLLILVGFSLSFLFYYLEFPLLLSFIYPVVISYYNFIVFSTLTREYNLLKLSIMMIFIVWISSGSGLLLSLL